jgi:hypothetical protein
VAITTIVTGTTSAQPHGPPPAITPRMATTRASRSRPALSAMATPAMTLRTFRSRRDSSTERSWHSDRSRGSRVIGLLRQPRRGDEFRRSSSGVIKGCWPALRTAGGVVARLIVALLASIGRGFRQAAQSSPGCSRLNPASYWTAQRRQQASGTGARREYDLHPSVTGEPNLKRSTASFRVACECHISKSRGPLATRCSLPSLNNTDGRLNRERS